MQNGKTTENINITRLYTLIVTLKDEIKVLHGEVRSLCAEMKGVKESVGKNK